MIWRVKFIRCGVVNEVFSLLCLVVYAKLQLTQGVEELQLN